jgi:hypothetical protein
MKTLIERIKDMAKATFIKVSGYWKQVKNIWTKVSGTWTEHTVSWVRPPETGSWKESMDYSLPPDPTSGMSLTDNGTVNTKPGQYNNLAYDFYLNNDNTQDMTLFVRLHPQGDWVNQTHEITGSAIVVPAKGSYHFTGNYDLTGTIPDPGYMDVYVELSYNNADWTGLGILCNLEYWSQ